MKKSDILNKTIKVELQSSSFPMLDCISKEELEEILPKDLETCDWEAVKEDLLDYIIGGFDFIDSVINNLKITIE